MTMGGVSVKFFTTSMFMWMVPIAILYAFNKFPRGFGGISAYSMTLLSGFMAVISVNVVIAIYIFMAMKEPSDKHTPDQDFLAEAQVTVKHSKTIQMQEVSPTTRKKEG